MTEPETGPDEMCFGPFRLDRRGRRLTRGAAVIPLGSRAFDLLEILLAADGDVVSKGDLLDRIWPGRIVEENNLQVQVSTLRKAVGDGWIVNVPGRGYQLAPGCREPSDAAPSLSGHPVLAVLPLDNLSDDPSQEYFAHALTEEITTALSRVRWFRIVARRSASMFKGGGDVREIGRALGARYVLEGSVRRHGTRLRLAGSLIDAENGLRLWSERFDGELADVFVLQDQLSDAVAGAIEPALRRAEISRAHARAPAKLDAYDLYLQSLPLIWAGTRDSYSHAADLLRRSVVIDPAFTVAKASLAFAAMNVAGLGWGSRALREEGARLASESLAEGWHDAEVLMNAGHALAFLTGDHDQALAALNRALVLNPSSCRANLSAGWIRCYRCEAEPAMTLFDRAIRLSPLDPEMGYALSGLGLAHLIAGEPAAALPLLQRSTREMPTWIPALEFLVAAYHWLGRDREATEAATDLLRLLPRLTTRPEKWAFRAGPFRDRFLVALRAAGVPGG